MTTTAFAGADLFVSALIVLGAAFALIGSWGLVRLPSLMERLHGPTKASTLGLGAMLVGSVAYFQLVEGKWTTHEMLITIFLFVTAPISANLIAKVHLHRLRQGIGPEHHGPAGEPVPPASGIDWATHETPRVGSVGDLAGD
jgi:multicomponent K+:H+ antiporter subunit G